MMNGLALIVSAILTMLSPNALAGERFDEAKKKFSSPTARMAIAEDVLELGPSTLMPGYCQVASTDAFSTAALVAGYSDSGFRFSVIDESKDGFSDLGSRVFKDYEDTLNQTLNSLSDSQVVSGSVAVTTDSRSKKFYALKRYGNYWLSADGEAGSRIENATRYCWFHLNLKEAADLKSMTSKRYFELLNRFFNDSPNKAPLNKLLRNETFRRTFGSCGQGISQTSTAEKGVLLVEKTPKGIKISDFSINFRDNGRTVNAGEFIDSFRKAFDDFSEERILKELDHLTSDHHSKVNVVRIENDFLASEAPTINTVFRYKQYGPYLVSSMAPLQESDDVNPDRGVACAFFDWDATRSQP